MKEEVQGARPLYYPIPLGLLLLAFALQTYRLGWQSLWSDEGASVVMTTRSLPQIITASGGDIHPPLYYILLSWWSQGAGTSEFSLRFLSVVFGIILIAVLYQLGRRLFSVEAGILTAFLGTISPFLIYYAQEARMYMLGALLCALAALFCLKALGHPRYWAAYALAAAAALYTQYFTLGVILALSLFSIPLLLFKVRARRQLAWWLGAQIGILLLYLPWLPTLARQFSTWPATTQPFTLLRLLEQAWLAFSRGPLEGALPWQAAMLPLLLAATALGYILWAGKAEPSLVRGVGFVLLYLAVPLAILYVVSLRRPTYDPKFLLFAAPAYYLLLGLGAAALLRLASLWQRPPFRAAAITAFLLFSLLIVATPSASALRAYYFDPSYARDDYRSLAGYIQASARPGDAIILDAPGQKEIFDYYYQGSLPIYPLPRQRPIDEAATAQDLEWIAGSHSRLWVVFWAVQESDPTGFVERWLGQKAYKTAGRWYGNVRLALYQLPSASGETRLPVHANLGGKARLISFSLASSSGPGKGPLARLVAGDTLPLTLFWESLSPMTERYKVFVHLLGPRLNLWGQHDSEPAGGSRPTPAWQPGETIADNHGLPILPGTPPGRYQIEVGMYHPLTGQRLPVIGPDGQAQGDRVVLGSVLVERPAAPPSLASLAIEYPLEAHYGGLRLLGYEFFKLGTQPGNLDLRSGERAHLALLWQADRRPQQDYRITALLLDEAGQVAVRAAGVDYPTSQWQERELVRDQYQLPLNISPGRYLLALHVQAGQGEVRPTGPNLRLDGERLILREVQVK